MLLHKLLGAGTPMDRGWDIRFASYVANFLVVGQTVSPQDIRFKPDGTKMYVLGNRIYEYTLSTPWALSTATFTATGSINYGSTIQGLEFKPDGGKTYVCGGISGLIYEANLATPWNITTGSSVQSIAAGDAFPSSVYLRADGLRMYVLGLDADTVREFALSTAWNLSTATFTRSFSVAAQDTSPRALFFRDDGTRMYMGGGQNNSIYQYDLSTAWNVSTAVFIRSFSDSANGMQPFGVAFSGDGSKMYVTGNGAVWQYNLT